jgi:hypothetical protein
LTLAIRGLGGLIVRLGLGLSRHRTEIALLADYLYLYTILFPFSPTAQDWEMLQKNGVVVVGFNLQPINVN